MEMTDITPQEALAITASIHEFAWLIDHGRAEECDKLFTEDAKITFGPGTPKPGALDGIAAVKAFLQARKAQTQVTTRHVMSNIRFTRQGPDEIAADSVLTLYRAESETRPARVAFIADFAEIYAKQPDGGWKLKDRLITPIFSAG